MKTPFDLDEGTDEATDGSAIEDKNMLGDAAQSALDTDFGSDESVKQEPLDGTEYLKIKFVGMSMDSLDREIALGTMMTFVVEARCIGVGTDLSKLDGHTKPFAKMDVQSVRIKEA